MLVLFFPPFVLYLDRHGKRKLTRRVSYLFLKLSKEEEQVEKEGRGEKEKEQEQEEKCSRLLPFLCLL
jgi:hypothetical protein